MALQPTFYDNPRCSAFIVDSALANIAGDVGIGMFRRHYHAPACSVAVIIPLPFVQRRLSSPLLLFQTPLRRGWPAIVRKRTSFREFVSQIDLGVMVLLRGGGCAMPVAAVALAGNTADGWRCALGFRR